MRPSSAIYNLSNCPLRNAVLPAEMRAVFTGGVPTANFLNLGLINLFVETAGTATSLLGHIPHVVSVSAQEKMLRVHARRIIAAVKHKQTIWNWVALVQYPRNPVCYGDVLPIAHEQAVAVTVTRSYPKPAGIEFGAHGRPVFINVFPEPICEWYFETSHDVKSPFRFSVAVRAIGAFARSSGLLILT